MAQISIYVDNKTSIKFLQMEKEERANIRKVAQASLIREINKVPVEPAKEDNILDVKPLYA